MTLQEINNAIKLCESDSCEISKLGKSIITDSSFYTRHKDEILPNSSSVTLGDVIYLSSEEFFYSSIFFQLYSDSIFELVLKYEYEFD